MTFRFLSASRRAVVLCAAALLQSLAMPVLAQTATPNLASALRETGAPQTLRASELSAQWKRFTRGAVPNAWMAALAGEDISEIPDITYYTRGETIKIASETYLLAYRVSDLKQVSEEATPIVVSQDEDDDEEETTVVPNRDDARLPRSAVLSLSLLNLRTTGDLRDVRAVDVDKEVMSEADEKQARDAAASARSTSNLKQIGLGLMQYIQDYDETFPPMRSVQSAKEILEPVRGGTLAKVQQVLQPYLKNAAIFSHPTTRELYQPNPALAGASLEDMSEPARVVAFWEKSAASDATRAVLYADGHVRRERESEWPKILATSNKLLPPRKVVPKRRSQLTESPDYLLILAPTIKTAFGANSAFKGSAISVSIENKNVTLEGTARSDAQKVLASRVAKEKAPGYLVVNKLLVPRKVAPQRRNIASTKSGEKPKGKARFITGMKIEDLRLGMGKAAEKGDKVSADYRGRLTSGKIFDESYKRGEPFVFQLGEGMVIEGWEKGVVGMKKGGKRRLTIPGKMAYGENSPSPDIPANATLIFDIELRKIG